MVLARRPKRTVLWRAHPSREAKRLINLESREVDVVLPAGNNIAATVPLNLLGEEGIAVNGDSISWYSLGSMESVLSKVVQPETRASKDDRPSGRYDQ